MNQTYTSQYQAGVEDTLQEVLQWKKGQHPQGCDCPVCTVLGDPRPGPVHAIAFPIGGPPFLRRKKGWRAVCGEDIPDGPEAIGFNDFRRIFPFGAVTFCQGCKEKVLPAWQLHEGEH